MTPACTTLKRLGIAYSEHIYQHDPHVSSYGLEAAEKLGLAPHAVFKTLLVSDEKHLMVTIVPVTHQLSLKKMAHACGVKKIWMARSDEAERSSGYLLGGISPIGQKKRLKTVLDDSALALNLIYVSGGRRGLDIGLTPTDLIRATDATTAHLRDD